LKDQLEQGAIGLKLWAGHTGEIFPEPKETLYDYLGPLNRSDMDEIYEYCEANAIPIIWHMKLYWNYIYNEISDVLQRFPNLIVNIPHFGVLGSDFTRLEQLMDEYPGVYTDISFGGFAYWSMQKMSNNSGVYKSFVENYNDRVMFGTDIVMTRNERKTTQWLVNHTMAYRHMLEKDEFYVNIPNITGEGFDLKGDLNGLGLADEILNKIYFETPLRFLKGEPGVEKTNGSRAGVRNENDLILIHDEYFDSGFFAYSVMGVAVVVVYNNKLQI
jgi:hypothetical protein